MQIYLSSGADAHAYTAHAAQHRYFLDQASPVPLAAGHDGVEHIGWVTHEVGVVWVPGVLLQLQARAVNGHGPVQGSDIQHDCSAGREERRCVWAGKV
jgi:hypothetical protein